jgi:type II secretory pathway pseudopilin PulG
VSAHSIDTHDTRNEAGFTLVELMMSVAILMVVSGLMMTSVLDMSRLGAQQSNHSEMHAGIRNATALLQQEVGQAGRVAFPVAVTLGAVTTTGSQWQTVPAAAIDNFFVDMRLSVGAGDNQEIVTVTGVNTATSQFQADFAMTHAAPVAVRPAAGFAEGVIPTTRTNGSTPSVLKILGDISDDGNLVYVEYRCDWEGGRLYRNMMPYSTASKPALTVQEVLLDNLLPNPPNPDGTEAPCFTYEQRTVGSTTYVINVAIMTTVRTHLPNPITGEFQTVTKALLNVAPRNVFNAWQIASLGYNNRIQPLPQGVVQNLLPN